MATNLPKAKKSPPRRSPRALNSSEGTSLDAMTEESTDSAARETPTPTPGTKSIEFSSLVEVLSKQNEKGEGDDDELDRFRDGSHHETETALDDTKKQLEDLQMRTVYTLVEDIEIEVEGVAALKKLLFVTNKQARMFDLRDTSKFMQAFDITPKPKLVINLMFSTATCFSSHPFGGHWSDHGSFGDHCFYSEESETSLRETDRRVSMFLTKCVLPVAIQTNALVVTRATGCSLSKAFGEVCKAEASKRGGALPFTVVTFSNAAWLPTSAESLAGQIRSKSKRWKERIDDIDSAVQKSFGHLRFNYPHGMEFGEEGDLPSGGTHYVVCDSVANRKYDSSALKSFSNSFVQRLTEEIPSIAFQTLAFNSSYQDINVSFVANYAERGLPVVLLDSRPIPPNGYPGSVEEATTILNKLNETLHQETEGNRNLYWASTFAFFHQVIKVMKSHGGGAGTRQEEQRQQLRNRKNNAKKGIVTKIPKGQVSWIWVEIERIEEEKAADEAMHGRSGEGPQSEAQKIASLTQSAVQALTQINANNVMCEIRHAAVKLERLREMAIGCESAEDLRTFVEKVGLMWSTELMDRVFKFRFEKLCASGHFQVKEVSKNHLAWIETLTVSPLVLSTDDLFTQAKAVLVAELEDALAERHREVETASGRNAAYGLPMDWSTPLFMDSIKLLSSPSIFSSNLDDVEEISRLINKVAKIDRLPSSNSPEALAVIQQCWDSVDIFSLTANKYKVVTKVSYAALIINAALLVVTIALGHNLPDTMSSKRLETVVIVLSLFGSFVASFVTYLDPATKWQQLRGASLELESEIWKFRTRTGDYSITQRSGSNGDWATAEEKLRLMAENLNNHVLKSGSVVETGFFSLFKVDATARKDVSHFHHGQYPGCGVFGTFGACNQGGNFTNDHQSPIKPNEYLKLRVVLNLEFYQKRIPIYYRTRTAGEVLLILGGLSGTILAFLRLSRWAGATAAVTFLVTSWLEFSSTSQKLKRYSQTISNIGAVIRWWQSLSDVDRSSQLNIDKLVSEHETLFKTERQSWVATSLTNKMLSKEAGEKKDEDEEAFLSTDATPINQLQSKSPRALV